MDSNIIARKWIQGMTVKPDSLLGQAFTGEEGAHVFRITGETTGGAAAPITGTIAAKFLRSDNITVPLSGSVSDGVAVVTLTDECYLVPGRFIFSIYVTQGDLRMCIYCGVGNVFRTDSGEYEGGQIITDITELINEIQEAVESIPPDYSELTGEVADLKSAFIEKSIEEYGLINTGTLTSGKYIKQADGYTANSESWSITDFLPVIPGSKLLFTAPETNNETQLQYVSAIAFYTTNSYLNFNSSSPVLSGTIGNVRWTTVDVPSTAKYFKASIYTASATNYKYINVLPIADRIEKNTDDISVLNGAYSYDGAFTANGQVLNTGIAVKAGHVYTVKIDYTANDFANGQINVFSNGSGGSANYVAVLPDLQQHDFVCGVDGYLCLYNVFGYIGTVSVGVVENISRANQKMGVTYYVGQYEREKSLTALLLKLKNDKSPKTIIIRGGDYDIFSEYKALQQSGDLLPVPESGYDPTTQYVPYNVFIPDNTHIVGEGLVRLNYMPTVSQTSSNEAKTLSPINVAGSMTLENVEINCKNGRYCIHDDPVQDPAYNGAIKKYINVRCTKYTNDDADYGTPHNFGCGVSRAMRYEFDNCYFESKSSASSARTLYFHDRIVVGGVELQEKMSSNIVVKNTIIKSASGNLAVYFGNIGATGLNIRVDIDSCWTNGNIVSADENSTGTTGNNSNSFNIKTLLSHYNSIIVRDANNAYPPQEFGLE